MQPQAAQVDPSILACPHFGYAWKTSPEEVPKHVKCLAVAHHFAAGKNTVHRIRADQCIEEYLRKFGVRSTRDHEIQTLIHKGLIKISGDNYVFDSEQVNKLLSAHMIQCRG